MGAPILIEHHVDGVDQVGFSGEHLELEVVAQIEGSQRFLQATERQDSSGRRRPVP
jgi:hypothetical protein